MNNTLSTMIPFDPTKDDGYIFDSKTKLTAIQSVGRIANRAALLIAVKHQNKGNMKTLILALIAVRNQHRQTEKSLPEPNDFQPFDLQALRNLYKAKDIPPSRPAGQQRPYAAQTAF